MAGSTSPSERAPRAATDAAFADVLCAIDGKEGGYTAVEQGAALAGPDGRLTLLAVTSFRAAGAIRGPALGPARVTEILERAAHIAREANVPFTSEVDPATPPADVVSEWGARYDLLALGAPPTSWLAGLFSAGVGDTVLAELPTPLLLARAFDGAHPFAQRIVVASDGLEASDALVDLAARLARTAGARLTLVHASGGAPLVHRHAAEHERRIDEQRVRLEAALPASLFEALTAPGHAHEVIVSSAAAAEASLIVLGSRRLDGLRAIGSVSRRVAHEAQCSVLLVPPERLTA